MARADIEYASIPGLVRAQARALGDREALVDDGGTVRMSYQRARRRDGALDPCGDRGRVAAR